MKDEIRVLFYAGGFASVGGIEVFIRNLLVALSKYGYGTRVVCWGQRTDLLDEIALHGVGVVRYGFRWGCRWGWPDRVLLRRGCLEIRKADVVFFGKLFSRRIHEALNEVRGNGRWPRFVLATPYRPKALWGNCKAVLPLLSSFDVIVVQSRLFEEDLREIGYEGTVRIIPYLVPDAGPVAPMPPTDDGVRIGFLGRLASQKNVSYLLAALAFLVTQTDQNSSLKYEVHLFGDGPEEEKLRQKAKELGVDQCVVFHGRIRHDAVAQAIDSCHLFAVSSTTEGQCLAVLEALSRGRPVVGTRVGALPDVLEAPVFGATVPLGKVRVFAATLREVALGVFEGRINPRNVRRQFDRTFAPQVVLQRYVNLIEGLASNEF